MSSTPLVNTSTSAGLLPAPPPCLARLDRVGRRRGGIQALDGVSFDLPGGAVTALLGVNGAGKSTAIEVLLGLQPVDTGHVVMFDRPPGAADVRGDVGAMLQQMQLPERLRVCELLALVRSWYAAPRSVADCIALAGLDGLLDRRYGRLSGGQQRRVQFALAMCGRPRLLILDEPTTGLDIGARHQLWRAVRDLVQAGTGVLLTTHDMAEVEALADRVVVLDRGRVRTTGSVVEVRARVDRRHVACDSALEADVVAAWPGVVDATRTAGRLRIVAIDADAVVRRLFAADPGCANLEVRQAGLADALELIDGADIREAA